MQLLSVKRDLNSVKRDLISVKMLSFRESQFGMPRAVPHDYDDDDYLLFFQKQALATELQVAECVCWLFIF